MSRHDFGRYKIVEEVGRGAMGVVYRAQDPVMGRIVAIKAINAAYLESVGVKASEYFERFRREAEVAGRLSHKGIVTIYDLGSDYLVMEFIEGQSLASLLGARARLPAARILRILGEVAEALDHAHERGIVHRDVKPGNIMIQPDGVARVMDFGLARVDSSTLTAAGEILGSASYMAPEVVLGRPADARSDIFSLGVVAYEMMTGSRPFGGASITLIVQNIVRASPKPPHEVNPHLPPELEAIFTRVLAKEPVDRYPAAGAFAAALAHTTWEEPEAAPAESVADAGSQTVMLVDAEEVGEPDNPLADLVGAAPLDSHGPTASLPPGSDLQQLARDAAATRDAGVGPDTRMPEPAIQVAPAPAAALSAPPAPEAAREPAEAGAPAPGPAAEALTTPRDTALPTVATSAPASLAAAPASTRARRAGGGRTLVLALAAAAVFLLAFGGTVVYLGYRWLVSQATVAEAPPTTVTAAQTPPATEQATPEATPVAPAASLSPSSAATPAAATPTPTPTRAPATPAATVTLAITSEPAGARVQVGKKARGLTPLRLQVPPGKVALVVEKDGFKSWKREVLLTPAGLKLEARLERLAPEPTTKPAPTPAGVKAGDLVPLGPDVTPPKRLSGDPPDVPPNASKASGSVLVEFVVDEDGRTTDAKVSESAGAILDAACLDAVKRWRYSPASTQGVKVKVVLRARFRFQSR